MSYPNPAPALSNPANFNPMDSSTWPTQTMKYRFSTFVVQETAKEIDDLTLSSSGKTIQDIVNAVESTALNQVTTQIVNGALQAGVTVNIVGVSVDAGYSARVQPPLPPYIPFTLTYYKVWYAAYVVYDSDTDLTTLTLSAPTQLGTGDIVVMSYVAIPLIVWALALVLAAIIAVVVVVEIADWLKSMTTTTNTTTTHNSVTNPSDQSVTIHTPNGDVTIPPGGTYTWDETSTTTSPNLAGILSVGAVTIGLVGVGIFSYAFLKGLQKPK